MERSLPEKEIYKQIWVEEEPLDYPLREHEGEMVYEIPDEDKPAILRLLWPFVKTPALDAPLMDIHEGKMTCLRNCQVIRFGNYNIIVSEFYFISGGCVVDLVEEKDGRVCTLNKVKENKKC